MVKCFLSVLLPSCVYLSVVAQESVRDIPKSEDTISRAVHLISRTSEKDNKILLQWEASDKIDFYIIERSSNRNPFEVIGAIKGKSASNGFEFTDEMPSRQGNRYRIKMQALNHNDIYSETIAAGFDDSLFCKFYPNPVDKLLILRSDYAADVKITDVMGNTRITQKLKPGLQILDVSLLEKNIYVITIFHQNSNQFITKKLIKN